MKEEIKAVKIRFFDNDFGSQAIGALEALSLIMDLTTEPKEEILREFKLLIHNLANVNFRREKPGYREVSFEYFDKCTIASLRYVPKTWENGEAIICDFSKDRITLL